MVPSKAEDYEVISILSADVDSTCYKVRHKTTQKIFVWKAVACECLSKSERQQLLSQVEKTKEVNHTHSLRIHDYILQEEAGVLYLVCEYCANDNLTSAVRRCLLQNERLHEDFLWRILYQASSALAVGDESLLDAVSTDNMFLDADFNLKLFDSNILKLPTSKVRPLFANLGLVMLQLCTLQMYKLHSQLDVSVVKNFLTEMPNYYSNELRETIIFLSTANLNVKSVVNAILCHPTVLIKSCVKLDTIYIANGKLIEYDKIVFENITNTEIETVYRLRLERTRAREMALKLREEKLAEKEHELRKREKKVAQMEVAVKEKMLQAKVYLRRCRTVRFGTSSSSAKTPSYDDVDSSFSAFAEDVSVVMATSNKMDLQRIKKPARFTKAASDKKVHFKGHSPLKDTCARRSVASEENKNHNYRSSKCLKNIDLRLVSPAGSEKPLADANVSSLIPADKVERSLLDMQRDRRPFSWTEENKQQAFDLLRLLNKTNKTGVKHTNL